jgi:predicted transcriptional regulator YdeE
MIKVEIQREILINKSAEEIFKILADYSQWNNWSPWRHSDPEGQFEVLGAVGSLGHCYKWSSPIIGSGQMTLTRLQSPQTVEAKLEFLKPFRSEALTSYRLERVEANKTKVSWTLNTSLPFFLFFFKKMFQALIAQDYERGLLMLKELCEKGRVSSKSSLFQKKAFEGFKVVGRKVKCSIDELSEVMQREVGFLNQKLERNELSAPEALVCLQHKHDFVVRVSEFTVGFKYSEKVPVKVAQGYQLIGVPEHSAIAVEHLGSYEYLANPWNRLMANQKSLKIKLKKSIPMYEVYSTRPDEDNPMNQKVLIVAPVL